MKTESMRGMRDIPTIEGLRHRSLPTTREQTVADVARLEHEKARLNRELNLWLEHQKRTEKQLRQVEERLALLQQILDPLPDEGATRPVRRPSPAPEADSGEGEARGWQEISLEY